MIAISQLIKRYEDTEPPLEVLHNISFSIQTGEFVVIRGKSGSGKTTLLNILSCLDDFQDGQYLFNGKDISSYNEKERALFRNRKIGFVFQAYNLINDLTVFENVELPLGYSNISSKKRKILVESILRQVDIGEKAKKFPHQLSGGQQQRVAIARALVNNPDIIIADEPTGNLDSENGAQIMSILQSLNRNQNKTILMVTHDDLVASYASREIMISDGKIL